MLKAPDKGGTRTERSRDRQQKDLDKRRAEQRGREKDRERDIEEIIMDPCELINAQTPTARTSCLLQNFGTQYPCRLAGCSPLCTTFRLVGCVHQFSIDIALTERSARVAAIRFPFHISSLAWCCSFRCPRRPFATRRQSQIWWPANRLSNC